MKTHSLLKLINLTYDEGGLSWMKIVNGQCKYLSRVITDEKEGEYQYTISLASPDIFAALKGDQTEVLTSASILSAMKLSTSATTILL